MQVRIPIRLPELPPRPLPVRATLPFPRGALRDAAHLRVLDVAGRAVASQARTLLSWPDGSARWALVVFEPPAEPGAAAVVDPSAAPREEAPIARADGAGVAIDTGEAAFTIASPPAEVDHRDRGVLTGARAAGGDVTCFAPDAGLLVTDADGRIASSQKAGPALAPARWEATMEPRPPLPSFGIGIVESGPVRALVRIEGRTAYDAYRAGLDYRIWLEAYRGRSLVRMRIAWIHRDAEVAHFIRDIRFRIPLAFPLERAHFAAASGTFEAAVRPGATYRLLQADADRFVADRLAWDGRRFDLCDGAANGPAAPGWLLVEGADGRALGIHVAGFAEEHPTEIAFARDRLEIGLWPEGANAAQASGVVLPPLADGVPEHRHRKLVYECLCHHPYRAFIDAGRQCLETVQGMQKSREVVIDLASSADAAAWQRGIAEGRLEMPLGMPDPEAVCASEVIVPFDGVDAMRRPRSEQALERAACWLERHPVLFSCRGAFDWGDLRYLVADGRIDRPWRSALEQHPRAGYWNNNEEDPVHGLFLHALRTADPRWRRLSERMGRHLWDIDVRHWPPWGVHTHTEGHCFRSQTWTGTDHFWLEGLLDFYLSTGESDVLEGVRELAAAASAELERVEPARTDLRTVSLAVKQLVCASVALGDLGPLDRARAIARAAAADAATDGFLADYGSAMGKPRSPSLLFATLFIEAAAELDAAAPDPALRAVALRQIEWYLERALLPGGAIVDPAERATRPGGRPTSEDPVGGFQLLAFLGHAFRWTSEQRWLEAGRRILGRVLALQEDERFGPAREGCWATDGTLSWDEAGRPVLSLPQPGRPAGQIRPLGPATALRCLPSFLAVLERDP